ncbi:MAG: response regulator [Chlamydiia bacterium]|nr:response regulator [Chlamydiia bacterium]
MPRILIVDDAPVIRRIIKRNLSPLTPNIEEASNGQEALACLLAGPKPDLIVCDWNMPLMDGPTFLRTMRSRDMRIPVLMITTENEASSIALAENLGIRGYLSKPFTEEDLIRTVKSILR